MKRIFKTCFEKFVCEGDSVTADYEGFELTATVAQDDNHGIDDDDCHNEDPAVCGMTVANHKKAMLARAAWFENEWFYCGVSVSVSFNGLELLQNAASLWGIECNYPGGTNEYLRETADELAGEAVAAGRAVLAGIVEKHSEICGNQVGNNDNQLVPVTVQGSPQ